MASSGSQQPAAAGDGPPKRDGRSLSQTIELWRGWWRRAVVASVDQAEVIAERRHDSDLSPRYLFMSAMSAGIAILGLLLSSPAVVIGAMLLSPLMGPIIGLGFALATGDYLWIRQASRSLLYGIVLSVLLCAIIVTVSPLQTITSEIASRTRPNLFDLGVALFSALAGAYAMIRGREGTIVGVAIATALMPPLAVVGFGIATVNWPVFSGSLLLFFTNLMTIALTAALMARLYGFSTRLSKKQTHVQTALIVTAFIALAIPLGVALLGVAREAAATRQVNSALLEPFGTRALVSDLSLDLDAEPAKVSAVVLTPEIRPGVSAPLERELASILGRRVQLVLTQVPVGNSAQAVELAQLERSRQAEAAAVEQANDLAERLALIAGVSSDEVLVDRDRRIATVAARPLDGASLAAYRELERRISTGEPDWSIRLRPPARPLPSIAYDGEEPTEDGARALELIAWAGMRVSVPIVLSGPQEQLELAAATLEDRGVDVRQQTGGGARVTATWAAPDQ